MHDTGTGVLLERRRGRDRQLHRPDHRLDRRTRGVRRYGRRHGYRDRDRLDAADHDGACARGVRRDAIGGLGLSFHSVSAGTSSSGPDYGILIDSPSSGGGLRFPARGS